MKTRSRVVAAGLALTLTVGCASAPKVPVVGREVTVVPQEGGSKVKGELLAVGPEQLWIQNDDGIARVAFPAVREVRVKRHGFGGRSALTWALVGGLATGGALAGACASTEGTENCGVVGLITLGAWLLVGVLSAPSMESSSRLDFPQPSPEDLRPYARFPQGWPAAWEPPVRDSGETQAPR